MLKLSNSSMAIKRQEIDTGRVFKNQLRRIFLFMMFLYRLNQWEQTKLL